MQLTHNSSALDKAVITLDDVRAQEVLVLTNVRPNVGISSTTFFAPQCKFPKPAPGNLVYPRIIITSTYMRRGSDREVEEMRHKNNQRTYAAIRTYNVQ